MLIRYTENPFIPRMCRYNMPYDDEGYYRSEINNLKKTVREYEEIIHDKIPEIMSHGFTDVSEYRIDDSTFIGDIPKQNAIPTGSHLCGYVEIDGTYHECDSCCHEKNIRQIIWNNDNFRERYFSTPASFFLNMPRGMLQEEYFAMKGLGFVKISSFKNAPTKMIAFFYNTLTYKQTDLIYPR